MLNNKSILVTGGTGSFGQAFVKFILTKYPRIRKLIIYSRDELKQFHMNQTINEKKYPGIRYFLGDIRDENRLSLALEDVDIVIHAAALKHVSAAEYNPFEFVKTNIIGSQNIVNCCLKNNVKNVIAISTDKAVSPANLYGATKLCSDKLFLSANNILGKRNLKFSVVRYGNVFGSSGSVVPLFLDQSKNGYFNVTDKRMTRFNITLDECVKMVLWIIKNNLGSEIIIPKLKSYRITDLTKAINPKCKINFTGIKQGEKLHEELTTLNDTKNLLDIGPFYIYSEDKIIIKKYAKKFTKSKKINKNFVYDSLSTNDFLSINEIKKLIKDFKN